MIRKSALAVSIAALLTPAVAGALGLGNIQVTSALNEPLEARIPLRALDPGQIEDLRVRLADDQQFDRAGLDRAYILTRLKFKVVETSGGGGFISITTRDPVAEPFLNFLVDVNWSRGRVLREYTVLLDPPVYGAAISTGTQRSVQTVETLPAARAPAPAPAPAPAAAPAPRTPSAGTPSAAPRYSGDSYGPVQRGETLWSIADRVRPGGVSIQNMMLALLKANPEAFSLDNVNALKTGAVLRIPAASEVSGSQAAALEEVARQHALWAEYRQSVTGQVSPQPSGTAPSTGTTAAAPAATPATGDGQAAGEDSAELKLVGAGTSGAATGGDADVEALRNELTMAQEEADAARLENQELQSRLTEVEGLVGDLQRLVELKEDQLAALQDQLAKASEQAAPTEQPVTAPQPETTAASTQPQAETTAPAQETAPAVKPAAEEPAEAPKKTRRVPPPPPPAESKSFVDSINDMLPIPLWQVLAGLGAVLLGWGGMVFARSRKAKAAAAAAAAPAAAAEGDSLIEQYAETEFPSESDDVTELPESTEPDVTDVPSAEPEPTDMGATAKTEAAPTDDDDPLAEVNVYLAYERFDQAEQLVRDAVSAHPDRHDYKLKLLEVFYAAKSIMAFEGAAGELRDAVGDDHAMMQQAREWWSDLGAGRELFSDDGGPSTEQGAPAGADEGDDLFDVTAAASGEQTGVDFDLGFETGDAAGGDSGGVDFDLGEDAATAVGDVDSGVDFDLGDLGTATAAGAAAAATLASGGTGLDFDLSAEDGEGATAEQADTGVDFDLGEVAPAASTQDQDTGLDFDLDAGDTTPAATEEGGSVPERIGDADSDTGLDFDLGSLDEDATAAVDDGTGADSLDFDLGDTAGEAIEPEGTLMEAAGEESGLDFDLGDTTTLGDAGPGGAASEDGGLDLDLGDTNTFGDAAPAESAGEAAGVDDGLDLDLGDTGAADAVADAAADDGADSVLDFDLGDTQEVPKAPETAVDSALDFDLGDTSSSAAEAGSASAELDFDLGDTGAAAEAGSASAELDFDLGDTGTAAEAGSASAELDFDLGDTGTAAADGGELDFDLGDTGTAGDAGGGTAADDLGGTGGLDFDLGDTQEASAPAGVESAAGDAELDFDLSDTVSSEAMAGATAGEAGGELDLDLSETLDVPGVGMASAADSGGLDLDLGLGADDAAASSDGSGLDLDLSLDMDAGDTPSLTGDAGSDDGLPVLDMGDDESPAFDTVKLGAEDAASIRDDASGDAGTGSEFGVDTEFRGIFDDQSAGTESSVDFDLGVADLGAAADEGDATGMSDVESTQFMLQDVIDEGGEDEEDHTLVLGRGASGEVDEMQTKLDLAQAYMDMGDTEGARNLLGEVMAEGSDDQKQSAEGMLKQLS